MAESIVVSSVEWIGSLLIQEANVLLNVKDDVEKLKQKLEYVLEYLRDADAKSYSDEQVRVLTVYARKLTYDAEDLIDTYILRMSPNTHFSDRFVSITMASIKDLTTNFAKLDKFDGVDFHRWQKRCTFF